jgi:hypothetical protein
MTSCFLYLYRREKAWNKSKKYGNRQQKNQKNTKSNGTNKYEGRQKINTGMVIL